MVQGCLRMSKVSQHVTFVGPRFGWIQPDELLDHPEAFKNNWRSSLHLHHRSNDVDSVCKLCPMILGPANTRIYVNVLDVKSGVLYSGARVCAGFGR